MPANLPYVYKNAEEDDAVATVPGFYIIKFDVIMKVGCF